ncbi:Protein of unknown function [Humidesulfovibrio mexicanus]|uniref:Tlde1 domain-containing protein n=1 Tax=Humidesulfovibrio mexicanus TaxID=147047 RepID=A0A238Z1B4_9BACT|nr:tlde1 domain-containing protein [Humidesulfovibrio mexicanus]SNR76728.1 Protein of unknown function [Humidesulfovibrio mexicanus]
METAGQRNYITTCVSADGRHAAASISTKPGAGGDEQPFNTENGRYMAFTVGADGSISGGNEVRGKVTPPQKDKYPPPSPAPKEPHLVYSQKSGELRSPDGNLMDKGHSGYEDYRDKPEFEDEKNRGVIPRGNYKVTEVIEDTSKDERRKRMGQHILRLEPADAETRQRLKEMNRDGFWIHNGESPRASQGCILTKETTRRRIPVGSILRVTL